MLRVLRGQRRAITVALALACFLMFGYAIWLQQHDGLEPCPLCIFQRFAVIGLGCALLLAALVPDRWRIAGNASAVLIGLVGLTGIGIAGRHLYIQSMPEGSVPACGATLDYMLEVFPLADVLKRVFTGSGECAKVDWTLLGISMPGWVAISVLVLAALGIAANWRSSRR